MFSVKKCCYDTDIGNRAGFLIDNDSGPDLTLFPINRCLHSLASGSDMTARTYAYKIAAWLNYLEKHHKTYQTATAEDVTSFLRSILYRSNGEVISITEHTRSPHTVEAYFAAIRKLYIHLKNTGVKIAMPMQVLPSRKRKEGFTYGMVYAKMKPEMLIDRAFRTGKPPIPYVKWYTPEQADSIMDHFSRLRDKAIFSITLDGARIDEALSISRFFTAFNENTNTVTPVRSKRKDDNSEERQIFLSERSIGLIRDYIVNERSMIVTELQRMGIQAPDELFLNSLNRVGSFGKPVKYENFLAILKRAAKAAGLDPKLIRTHSGRSTRAQEIVRFRVANPGVLSDQQFLDIFGWKNPSSMNPYINRKDPQVTRTTAEILAEIDRQKGSKNEK